MIIPLLKSIHESMTWLFSVIFFFFVRFLGWQVKLLTELAHHQPCNVASGFCSSFCFCSASRLIFLCRILVLIRIPIPLQLECPVRVWSSGVAMAILMPHFFFVLFLLCLSHVGRAAIPYNFIWLYGYILSLLFPR